jgi:MFS family permease
MTATEWRSVLALGLVYALRMAGMFMVLPLLALYAPTLQGGATTAQISLAIGLYGLANAALQIPLGILSDRIGRKPVIYMGLLVFAAGSVIAGLGHDIQTIQLGRQIQGLGAVSSATQGLLADVTRDQVRTIAMSIVGAGVGIAFAGAMIAGPIIAAFTGLNGLFFLTAAFTLLTIPIVAFGVPTPVASPPKLGGLLATFLDWKLMRLDVGILLLQAVMSGLFVVLPVTIVATLHLPKEELWKLYLPVLAASIIPAFGAIAWAESHRRVPQVFVAGIVLLTVALCLLTEMYASAIGLVAAVFLFFAAFNFLEGTVPSLV